jgi:hypothetical protein
MENRDFDNFFESYLDIDSWAEKLEEKEYAVQSRRKKRLSKKQQEGQVGKRNNNNEFIPRQKNGKKTRNGAT